ncbi:MAG: ATP-binding cassette domain-containing protein [Candidatus Gastranaerophilales bacterium]|nr:ATP-binding cassette domain-containing protein [Candidatus Gastranaerophilales bacterium]
MIPSVEIKNLTKQFAQGEPAIDNLTLNIEKGKITGLIGPDGAGKTTLIRLIAGLLTPSKGEITTLELSPVQQRDLLNTKIGYMPQKFGLYEDLSVIENLNLYADLKGILKPEKEELFNKVLDITDLNNFRPRLAGALSGGMKQKLGLACTLLGKPDLLLLDEPSVGVDPISRRELIKMVRELTDEGMTIFWSTAYLDEAHSFDNCIVMNEGKIIYSGLPHNLSETTTGFEEKVIELMGGFNPEPSELAEKFELKEDNGEYVIEALDLAKKYGDFYAVKNNTFHIKKGEIFGLLGPNGAGKSTSFKMMCGLATPTRGTAKIMGQDILKNPSKARSYLGYMAQKFSLYGDMSVLQNLSFFSGVYGLNIFQRKEKINEIVDIFHFKKYLDRDAKELPLGYKQRLSLACAVMHNPPVLFLDEPTSGVDPITRREFWHHIKALSKKGVTVMVTTHFMDEAEFCDRISLFYKGEAIATGSPKELKTMANAKTMEEAFVGLIREREREIVKSER